MIKGKKHWKDLKALYDNNPLHYEDNKELFLGIASQVGVALKWFPEKFKADKDVAKIAFEQDINAFEFISTTLTHNKSFILSLMRNKEMRTGYLLIFEQLIDGLKEDKDVALTFTKLSPKVFFSLNPKYQSQKEFVLPMVKSNAFSFNVIEPFIQPFLDDKDIVLNLVTKSMTTLHLVSERLKNDDDVILASLSYYWDNDNFKHIPIENLKNRETVLKIAQEYPYIFEKLPASFHQDKAFILEVLEHLIMEENDEYDHDEVASIMKHIGELNDDNDIVLAYLQINAGRCGYGENNYDDHGEPIIFLGSQRLKELIGDNNPLEVMEILIEQEKMNNIVSNGNTNKKVKI